MSMHSHVVSSVSGDVVSSLNDSVINAASGAFAGLVSSFCVAPLDVVKTRLQAQTLRRSRSLPEHSLTKPESIYRGLVGSLKRIWSEEGIRGLYRGLGPMAIGYLPTWAIYFTIYERCKKYGATIPVIGGSSWLLHSLAAMTAGFSSTVVTNPIWVVKTRLMTQYSLRQFSYRNTPDAFRTIFRQEGLKAFYKGLGPSLFGISHVAVQFPLYERLKPMFCGQQDEPGGTNWTGVLIASSLSKMIASSLTYPHEVVRTRLQNDIFLKSGSTAMRKQSVVGLWAFCKGIYKNEGWKAFYSGMGTNLIRTVPASAVTLLTFEAVSKRLFTIKSEENSKRTGR